MSQGVLAGVISSAILFVAKISKIKVQKKLLKTIHYQVPQVPGQFFFASVDDFLDKFVFKVEDKDTAIDFTEAHIWDDSGVGAVDRDVLKFKENRNRVEVVGLDAGSRKLIDQLAIFKSENAKLPTH